MDMKMFLETVKEKVSSLNDTEIKYWKKQYREDPDVYGLPIGVELDVHDSLKVNYNSLEFMKIDGVSYSDFDNQQIKSNYTHDKYQIYDEMVLAA